MRIFRFVHPTSQNQIAIVLNLLLTSPVVSQKEKRIVEQWKNQYERESRKLTRREQILKAIADNYDTCEEIAVHTGIPFSTTYKTIKLLVRAGIVNQIRTKSPTNRNETRFELKNNAK